MIERTNNLIGFRTKIHYTIPIQEEEKVMCNNFSTISVCILSVLFFIVKNVINSPNLERLCNLFEVKECLALKEEKQGDRERQRETERDRERQRDSERQKQTETDSERQKQTQRERNIERETKIR